MREAGLTRECVRYGGESVRRKQGVETPFLPPKWILYSTLEVLSIEKRWDAGDWLAQRHWESGGSGDFRKWLAETFRLSPGFPGFPPGFHPFHFSPVINGDFDVNTHGEQMFDFLKRKLRALGHNL